MLHFESRQILVRLREFSQPGEVIHLWIGDSEFGDLLGNARFNFNDAVDLLQIFSDRESAAASRHVRDADRNEHGTFHVAGRDAAGFRR